MSQVEERKDLTRTQSDEQIHAQQVGKQYAGDGPAEFGKTEYLQKLTDSGLDQGTVNILDNQLTQDFLLSNLNKAEANELKWRMIESSMMRIKALHPPQGSGMTGKRRAFMLDDEHEQLEPLTDREKQVIKNFLHGIFARVTRGRGGWQQEQMSKTISVSEVRRGDDDEKDGFVSGLFS